MTEPNDIPPLTKFSPISELDLCKIVKAMPSKSCELDYMGTDKNKSTAHMHTINNKNCQPIT